MKKRGTRVSIRDFAEPLVSIPYAFWAIYWFENGFDWIIAVSGIILLFVILPALVVFRK